MSSLSVNIRHQYLFAFLMTLSLLPSSVLAKNQFEEIIHVPIKLNVFAGTEPEKKNRYVLTAQPIMSTRLTDDWDVIWRAGIKLVSKSLGAEKQQITEIGDTFISAFLSPVNSEI